MALDTCSGQQVKACFGMYKTGATAASFSTSPGQTDTSLPCVSRLSSGASHRKPGQPNPPRANFFILHRLTDASRPRSEVRGKSLGASHQLSRIPVGRSHQNWGWTLQQQSVNPKVTVCTQAAWDVPCFLNSPYSTLDFYLIFLVYYFSYIFNSNLAFLTTAWPLASSLPSSLVYCALFLLWWCVVAGI